MKSLGGRPPERESVASWSLVRLKGGQTVDGWIAGPVVGVECHMGPRIKPCLTEYGSAADKCPGCRTQLRKDWRGYLPTYLTEAQIPTVVCLSRDACQPLEPLHCLRSVRLGRGTRDTDAVWAVPTLKLRPIDSGMRERQGAQDICEWLVVMWKYQGLITAAQIRAGPTRAAAAADSAPLAEDTLQSLLIRHQLEAQGVEQPPVVSRESVNRAFAEKARKLRNGKLHHPPTED